jgi:RNA polymerase sigma-70 factor (ECF subfamily)
VRREHPRAWLLAVFRNAAYTWLARNRPSAVVLVDRRAQRGDAGDQETVCRSLETTTHLLPMFVETVVSRASDVE